MRTRIPFAFVCLLNAGLLCVTPAFAPPPDNNPYAASREAEPFAEPPKEVDWGLINAKQRIKELLALVQKSNDTIRLRSETDEPSLWNQATDLATFRTHASRLEGLVFGFSFLPFIGALGMTVVGESIEHHQRTFPSSPWLNAAMLGHTGAGLIALGDMMLYINGHEVHPLSVVISSGFIANLPFTSGLHWMMARMRDPRYLEMLRHGRVDDLALAFRNLSPEHRLALKDLEEIARKENSDFDKRLHAGRRRTHCAYMWWQVWNPIPTIADGLVTTAVIGAFTVPFYKVFIESAFQK